MTLYFFAVRDSKVDLFAAPMTFRSKGEAIRAFSDEVNRKDSALNAHPEDYSLFEFGAFDCITGVVSGVNPVNIGRADQFLREPRLVKEA